MARRFQREPKQRHAEHSISSRAEAERSNMLFCIVSIRWADGETAKVELSLEEGVQTGSEQARMTAYLFQERRAAEPKRGSRCKRVHARNGVNDW